MIGRDRVPPAALAACLAACSCGADVAGNSSAAAQSTASASAAASAPPDDARPSALPDPPAAIWDHLAPTLGAREADAPPEALRWSLRAGCPLRYGIDSTAVVRSIDGAATSGVGPEGVYLSMAVGWTAEGAAVRAAYDAPTTGFLLHDLRTPPRPMPVPPGLELALSGARVEPVGAATGWRSAGQTRGLGSYWLDLPTAGAPGSRSHPVVRSRASGGAAGRVPDVEERITLELVRWIDVAGARAAVLDAWSTTAIPDPLAAAGGPPQAGRPSMVGTQEMRGRFVVLASGRLLHARLHDDSEVTLTASSITTRQRHARRSEVRLIAACDGPTLPAFPAADSPGERAMRAAADLQAAMAKGDVSAASALLAPEVVAKHGRPAIEEALKTHVERYGASGVGGPVFTEVSTNADTTEVTTAGGAAHLQGRAGSHSVLVVHGVREVAGAPAIVSLRSAVTREADPILQIDATRVFTAATTDPRPP